MKLSKEYDNHNNHHGEINSGVAGCEDATVLERRYESEYFKIEFLDLVTYL